MEKRTKHPALAHLDAMVGTWDLTGSHPYFPGVVIRGRATFEWLAGGYFLISRSSFELPDIPAGMVVIGQVDARDAESVGASNAPCVASYFDSRGVARVYQVDASAGTWKMSRDDPGFKQRMVYTISADGQTVTCKGEMARDGKDWEADLQLTYLRAR